MPASGRIAKVFMDGEELDSSEVRSISIEFEQKPIYPEISCRHVDDIYHRCQSLGRRRILIDTFALRAMSEEILALREIIQMNLGVIDAADKQRFNSVCMATDTVLALGAK